MSNCNTDSLICPYCGEDNDPVDPDDPLGDTSDEDCVWSPSKD